MSLSAEIQHLTALLDDPDPDVAAAVQARIIERGSAVLPYLEAARRQQCTPETLTRINEFIDLLRRQNAERELADWLSHNGADALKGMYCIAKFIYHSVSYHNVNRRFNRLLALFENEIASAAKRPSALEKVRLINRVLFQTGGFSNNYLLNYDATGHFVHLALARRQVTPISLAMLYLCFAERLRIPIKIIELPKNFILLCDNKFYINPAMDGEIFGLHKIKQYSLPPLAAMESADLPCPDSIMMTYHLSRAIREVYEAQGKAAQMAKIDAAVKMLAQKMEID